eukprot:SAG11_NODE_658_length_7897_cov_13.075789_5_plen_124_part_00
MYIVFRQPAAKQIPFFAGLALGLVGLIYMLFFIFPCVGGCCSDRPEAAYATKKKNAAKGKPKGKPKGKGKSSDKSRANGKAKSFEEEVRIDVNENPLANGKTANKAKKKTEDVRKAAKNVKKL